MARCPEPHATINCQELLQEPGCTHHGWLRRRTNIGKVNNPVFRKIAMGMSKVISISWVQVYVVLHKGSLYFYKDEKAKKPLRAKTLYGFNRIMRAGEISHSEATWTLKIIHSHPSTKTIYLSAPSEQDMRVWMVKIKKEMTIANAERQHLTTCKTLPDYEEGDFVSESIYDDIERELFKPEPLPLPTKKKKRLSTKSSSSTSSIDDENSEDSDPDYVDPDSDENNGYDNKKPEPSPTWKNPTPSSHEYKMMAPFQLPGMTDKTKDQKDQPKSASETPKKKKPLALPKPSLDRSISDEVPKQKPRGFGNFKKSKTLPADDSAFSKVERGPPDGESGAVSQSRENEERETFWNSVYWYGEDKEQANQILRNIGKRGVFLVRINPVTKEKVLIVFDKSPCKYRIQEGLGMVYLIQDQKFHSVPELLSNYYSNHLPNHQDIVLTAPYVQYLEKDIVTEFKQKMIIR